MGYICENCGVVKEKPDSLCNPIGEEYKHKACTIPEAEVCDKNASEMQYTCSCGSISADPQHLCRPTRSVP